MQPLQVLLLGGFDLRRGDESVPPIPSRYARSLFAYLVVNRGVRHPRELLAERFWPELPGARARRRLSHTLWQIQDALGELPGEIHYIEATTDTLCFSPDAPCWVDVEEFERRFEQMRTRRAEERRRSRDLAALEQVVDLYRGDFLPGHYEDWVVAEQQRLEQCYLEALSWLVTVAKAQGAYEDALVYARRLTNQDPMREDGHREVMRLSMLLGRTSDAVRQFERCREVLAEELGTEPSASTLRLYDRITRQRSRGGVATPPEPTTFAERVPLVGRDRERSAAVSMLDRALAGHGGAVLVEGEAGVGKSRLLAEVVDDGHWRGFTVLSVGCRGPEGAGPYSTIRELLAAALTPLRVEQLRHRVESVWLATAATLLPVVRRALPPETLRLANLRQEEGAERVRDALAEVVAALAELDPLLVVVDDLQWCDAESLTVLEALAADLSERRMLVALGYRGDDARSRRMVWEAIRGIDRRTVPERLLLGPLDAFSTAELARLVAGGRPVGSSVATRLQRETGGNPLFVVETLRALAEEQRLEALEHDDAEQLPLPGSIREVVLARLDRLTPEPRSVFDTVVVGGDGTDLDTLAIVTELPRAAVADAVDVLVRRGLLRDVEDAFGLHHDQIRRAARSVLAPPVLRSLHQRLGEALEELHPDQVDRLAHHFAEAGVARKAAQYYAEAGRAAAAVHAYAAADAAFRRAAEQQATGPASVSARFDLLAEHEAILDVLGDRERQRAVLDEMAILAAGSQRRTVEVARRRAVLVGELGSIDVAIGSATEALEGARELGDPALTSATRMTLATVLNWAGRRVEAVPMLAEAAAEAGDPPVEAEVRTMLGSVLRELQRYDEAAAELEHALTLARTHGELREEARALSILGTVRMETGDAAAADELYRRAIERCRSIGFRRGEAISLVNHATVLYVRGEAGAAIAAYDEAAAIAAQLGDLRTETMVRMNRAFVRHAVVGDDDESAAELESALAFFEEVGDADFRALSCDALAGIALRQGELDAARRFVERGEGEPDTRPGAWASTQLQQRRAEVALEAGDVEAAARAVEAGQATAARHGLTDRVPVLLAMAGRVALAAGDPEAAVRATSEAVAMLRDGVERSYLVRYRHQEALAAAGRLDEAVEVAHLAREDLERTISGLVPSDRDQASQVPEHREVLAAPERLQPHRRSVVVAAVDAPSGRPLADEELVEVTLDLSPPSGAPTDPVERRRALLSWVVGQLVEVGGMPTVSDLAGVLDVSEATVRRDLKALRAGGVEVPTRGQRAG